MRYLDRNSDAPPPAGHAVAEAESEFLEQAFNPNIVVRGTKLCAWATFFWDGRGMSYQPLNSPLQKLRIYTPAMTDAEARELLASAPGAEQKILATADLSGLLNALFPANLWRPIASFHHCAHWLLWLVENAPPLCAQPLLRVQATFWQDQLDGAEKSLYAATNADEARALLEQWLGIAEVAGVTADLPEFPLPIPDGLRQRIEAAWTPRTIAKSGVYYRAIISRKIPRELKEGVAKISADYFKSHHSELKSSIVQELSEFLPMEEIGALRNIVPPDVPPPPPSDAALVADWFRNLYLPYREWSIDHDDKAVRDVCHECGASFAKWFLEFYPTALAAREETISFRRSGRIMNDRAGKVTLMIILDGIGIWDAKELTRHIKSGQKRLALKKNDWCFAAVPTVTEICKPAMRQGVAPRNVNPNVYALSSDSVRLLENENAAEVLRGAKLNDFYIWSLIQTDQTYHKLGDARTIRDNVRAALEGIAKRIASAVEAVPNHLKLNVVITTDHGRYLGRSERTIPLMAGMQSHQRAAWDGSGNASDLRTDFEILAGEKAARLHPERFGLLQPALVSIAEDSFVNSDGSKGADWFPHGGVWPEEVIIPWLEYQRDAEPPHVDGRISGAGVEGRDGEIEIHLTNSSPLELDVLSVLIYGGDLDHEFPLNQKLSPRDAKAITCRLSPWPSASKVVRLRAKCILRLPAGDQLTVALVLGLTSDSLQKRHANLDDLL